MTDGLQTLLNHPKIFRGDGRGAQTPVQGLATGYAELDAQLPGGGWPPGALSEILLGRYGIGELQLVLPVLAFLSQAEPPRWIAWVAPPYQPYPPALAAAGLVTERILLVRPRHENEGLWAAEQALRSGNCAAVLLWADRPAETRLRRLQLAAEAGGSLGMLFRSLAALTRTSPAALRLRLARDKQERLRVHGIKVRGGRPFSVVVAPECVAYARR